MSSALAGIFFTTEPPGKPLFLPYLIITFSVVCKWSCMYDQDLTQTLDISLSLTSFLSNSAWTPSSWIIACQPLLCTY